MPLQTAMRDAFLFGLSLGFILGALFAVGIRAFYG
jgi:hypothetical protein